MELIFFFLNFYKTLRAAKAIKHQQTIIIIADIINIIFPNKFIFNQNQRKNLKLQLHHE